VPRKSCEPEEIVADPMRPTQRGPVNSQTWTTQFATDAGRI